jgi:hypothetical protein
MRIQKGDEIFRHISKNLQGISSKYGEVNEIMGELPREITIAIIANDSMK